jgi:hypothetical protein
MNEEGFYSFPRLPWTSGSRGQHAQEQHYYLGLPMSPPLRLKEDDHFDESSYPELEEVSDNSDTGSWESSQTVSLSPDLFGQCIGEAAFCPNNSGTPKAPRGPPQSVELIPRVGSSDFMYSH